MSEREERTITLTNQQIEVLHYALVEHAWSISKRSRPGDLEDMDLLVALERILKPSIGKIEMLVTVDDLDKIIIADGVTARSATDRQFYDWADSLVAFEIAESPEHPWSLQHRLNLCNFLYKLGEITL